MSENVDKKSKITTQASNQRKSQQFNPHSTHAAQVVPMRHLAEISPANQMFPTLRIILNHTTSSLCESLEALVDGSKVGLDGLDVAGHGGLELR